MNSGPAAPPSVVRAPPARTLDDQPVAIRDDIIAAALARLGGADVELFVKGLTPEVIAAGAPWAPSTVRYHFGGKARRAVAGRLAFQRRDLALAMLKSALADSVDASTSASSAYNDAIHAMPVTRSMDGILAAINADIGAVGTGATAIEGSVGAERMYFLALASCDTDSEAARMLRAARELQVAIYAPMYEDLMTSLGRGLVPGRSIEDLAGAIYALLDGYLIRLRSDPGSPGEWIGETVLAIFAAFTVRNGAEPVDIVRELLGHPDS